MTTMTADPLIGRLVDGRYEIRERIARGGMATVYLALDRRLDRDVALKVMHHHLAKGVDGAAFISRFRREARAAARLAHPGVVAVYDQGVDGDTSYLTLEYVPGSNLRRELNSPTSCTVARCLDVLSQVLTALAAAHLKGFVHRDIKPENVLLDEQGNVKVADFGLTRAVTEANHTATGTIIGTVAYLAPEVVTSGDCDPRTDVYAVGIVAYEMLTGRLPHTGATPLQVAFHHVHDDVPAPSVQVDWLPPILDTLVGSLTARDPGARPANAQAALLLLTAARRTIADQHPDILDRPLPQAAGRPDHSSSVDSSATGSSLDAVTVAHDVVADAFVADAAGSEDVLKAGVSAGAASFGAVLDGAVSVGAATSDATVSSGGPGQHSDSEQGSNSGQDGGPGSDPIPAAGVGGVSSGGSVDSPGHNSSADAGDFAGAALNVDQVTWPRSDSWPVASPGKPLAADEATTDSDKAGNPHEQIFSHADGITTSDRTTAGPGRSEAGRSGPQHRPARATELLISEPTVHLPGSTTKPPAEGMTFDAAIWGTASDKAPGPADTRSQSHASTQSQQLLRTHRRRRITLITTLSILFALVVGGAWTWHWWNTEGPGAWTTVPHGLIGLPYTNASDLLTDAQLEVILSGEYSDTAPLGTVTQVSPAEGERVRNYSPITATVSQGIRTIEMPGHLVGMTIDQALHTLEQAGIAVGPVHSQASDTIPADTVIAVSHEPGQLIPHYQAVSLTTSSGPAPVTVTQQVGLPRAEAVAGLEALGLVVDFRPDEHSMTVPAGYVIAQSPPSGTVIRRTDTVELTISLGPPIIDVPDVVGMSTMEARNALTQAGFRVRENRYLGGLLDTVRFQSITGSAAQGTEITLTIW